MTFFTLFVVLTSEEVCTLRNVVSGITIADIKSRLEISAGLPSQIFKLKSRNGRVLEDDHVLELGGNVWDGFVLRAEIKENWKHLHEAVVREKVDCLLRERRAHIQISFGFSNEYNKETTASMKESGCVALYLASWAGSFKICQALLTTGVNPNGLTPHNRTPLFAAAARNNDHIVDILLTHGATVSSKDCAGDTPIDVARRNFARQCVLRILSFQRVMKDQPSSHRESVSVDINARIYHSADMISLSQKKTPSANISRGRPFTAKETPNPKKIINVTTKPDFSFNRRSDNYDTERHSEPNKTNRKTLSAEIGQQQALHYDHLIKNMARTSVRLSAASKPDQPSRTPRNSDGVRFRIAVSVPNSSKDRSFNKAQVLVACNDAMASSKILRAKSIMGNEKPGKESDISYTASDVSRIYTKLQEGTFAKRSDVESPACILDDQIQNFVITHSSDSNEINAGDSLNNTGPSVNISNKGDKVSTDNNINIHNISYYTSINNTGDNINVDNGDKVSINNNSDNINISNLCYNISMDNTGHSVNVDNGDKGSIDNSGDKVNIENIDKNVNIENAGDNSLDDADNNINKDEISSNDDLDKKDSSITMDERNVLRISNKSRKCKKNHTRRTLEKDVRPMTAGNSLCRRCSEHKYMAENSWKTALRQIQLSERQKRRSSANDGTRETFDQWLRRKQKQDRDANFQDGSDDSSSVSGDERNALSFHTWLKQVRHRSKPRHTSDSGNSINQRKTVTFHSLVEIQTPITDQTAASVDPHSYMYAYKQWREKHNKLKDEQTTTLDVKEAKKLLKEKNQQMLARAITFNEWMTHIVEQKKLMRLIHH